jgi:hypothetical protein
VDFLLLWFPYASAEAVDQNSVFRAAADPIAIHRA